jgi:CubicO group peptidase (beta-lactamase class C family)
VVSKAWVDESTQVDTRDASPWFYQRQWSLGSEDGAVFMASGHLGQWVWVDRPRRIVIVRLGTSLGSLPRAAWERLLADVAARL